MDNKAVTKKRPRTQARREYEARWREAHRQELNAYARERGKTPEMREYQSRWNKARRANATPEELKAIRAYDHAHYVRYKATYNANAKLWRERNTERTRAYQVIKNANRRARIKAASGSWTWEQFKALCDLTGNRCYYCGSTTEKLTPDHAIPLARGGSNDITNIVPACLPCNVRKATMTTDEYIARLTEEA
jgi:5-methylcytosine-specific restriction endonuclease McrA